MGWSTSATAAGGRSSVAASCGRRHPSPSTGWQAYDAEPADTVDDGDARRALLDLATVWVTESNGRAEAIAVDGTVPGALAALGARRGRLAEVDLAHALAAMAWTGASGGAH